MLLCLNAYSGVAGKQANNVTQILISRLSKRGFYSEGKGPPLGGLRMFFDVAGQGWMKNGELAVGVCRGWGDALW